MVRGTRHHSKKLYGNIVSQLLNRNSGNRVHRQFSEAVENMMSSLFGSSGDKLAGMSAKKFQVECQKVLKIYETKALTPNSLKDLSPWLSKFTSLDREEKIEIPGQYTGRSKPMPEYHVNISGFDQTVLVLKSKQRPCRITIRGDDEKEYRFLVKTGEDLRQDDRIERLFEVMNTLFLSDPVCRSKHLQLVTYNVVPLTTRIGLIQWLDNTMVLKDFLLQGLDSAEREELDRAARSFQMHSPSDYVKSYENQTPQQVAARFSSCVRPASRKALRKALLSLSSCPEAFFTLRSRFVSSHAALCVAHWVLGIGDRHLGNFLVSTDTGLEVGIDFGYAFGVATQFLPVPELMPFRLTPQYLGVVEPLGKEGPLACAMQHALRALRADVAPLLDVLDVFVQEPTIDWMRLAKKQSLQTGGKKGKLPNMTLQEGEIILLFTV